MNICPQSNFYLINNRPSFSSNMRHVRDKKVGNDYWTTTYFFRDDLEWLQFYRLLDKKYKDVDKVNVLNHACSNGAEAMSLAMILMANMGAKSDKFFPIIAKDKNATNIGMAKNDEPIEIDRYDEIRLEYLTNHNISGFFYRIGPTTRDSIDALVPKPILKSKIKYSQGNILEDVKKLPAENNVVMCRNMWLYLNDEQQEELAKQLSEKLDDTSLVVIGHFDEVESNAVKLLNKYGFKETDVELVYEKTDEPIEPREKYQDARLYPVTTQYNVNHKDVCAV